VKVKVKVEVKVSAGGVRYVQFPVPVDDRGEEP